MKKTDKALRNEAALRAAIAATLVVYREPENASRNLLSAMAMSNSETVEILKAEWEKWLENAMLTADDEWKESDIDEVEWADWLNARRMEFLTSTEVHKKGCKAYESAKSREGDVSA